MLKQFLMKKMVQSQLSKVPEEYRALLMSLVENHPDLLAQMAQDLQALMGEGKSQEEAFQVIAEKYKEELKKIVPPQN